MAQERKLVTVLFADIVGSTEIGRKHDPEVVRETLRRTFARLREILIAHGGTVEKFIGDAVMAVFGMPTSHEDDADRAVRAAFALQRTVDEANAREKLQLALRVGVNSGEAVAGSEAANEFLVTGEAVNEAARLQQLAVPGEILVGALTRQLTERGVRFDTARLVEAKGVGQLETSRALELLTPLPEQRRGIAGLRAPLVGRDEEMRLLLDTLRRVRLEKRPYLVTVFGNAGAGKSRVTEEFLEVATAPALRGRCLPYGEGITYWPVQEMLRAAARIEVSDAPDEASAKIRAAVLAAFGDDLDDADAVARRLSVLAGVERAEHAMSEVASANVGEELRWAFRRYLERRASTDPLVVVFEDIHWGEPSLFDLIEHLGDWARSPLLVLCLARPELLEVRPAWAGGKRNAAAIDLAPLSAADTRRLIGALLSLDALPEALRVAIIDKADGNPLYVEEFLRMLIDSGHVERRDDRWVAGASLKSLIIPPTLHGIIAARLDRLTPAVKRTLQRASVVGNVFWTDAVSALDGGEARVDDTLLEAARRDLIGEADERGPRGARGYRFKHILIRDVTYAGITKADRSRLHERFARWLEESSSSEEFAEIVAYHTEQAFLLAYELGANVDELGSRAFERLRDVARRAARRGDLHAALALYERAAIVADALERRDAHANEVRGYVSLLRAQVQGTPESVTALRNAVDEARRSGPSALLVRLLIASGLDAIQQARLDDARELHREAVAVAERVGDSALMARALYESQWPAWWLGDLEETARILARALAAAREGGATSELAVILGQLSVLEQNRGNFAEGLALIEEAERVAASTSKSERSELLRRWSLVAFSMGDYDTAVRIAEQSVAVAREVGSRWQIGRASERLGEGLYAKGELDRSRLVLDEGLAVLDPATMRGAVPEVERILSTTYLAMGDLASARKYAEASRRSLVPSDIYTDGTTSAALAAVRRAEGRPAEGERILRAAIAAVERTGYGRLVAELQCDLGELLLEQGRHDEAQQLLVAARDFYSDPIAGRKRAEIDSLLGRARASEARHS